MKKMKSGKEIDANTPLYTISTIANALGVSVQTIRLYEKEHLIIPYQKASKHRLYSNSDLERLKFIRSAINTNKVGIGGLKIIMSLIPCWDIINCPNETRIECTACSGLQPCWASPQKSKICENKDCRTCVVYFNYNSCNKIKDGIKEISRNK